MTVRPSDILLYGGGECLERFGVPFLRHTRSQDVAATFTRTGGVGYSVDRAGKLVNCTADRLRVTHPLVNGSRVPALLVEPASDQLVISIDISGWTLQSAPTITGGQADPAGGTSAFLIEDTDGTNVSFPYHQISPFTGDGEKGFAVFVKEGPTVAAAGAEIELRDSTAGVPRGLLRITGWTDGVPTISDQTGETLEVRGPYLNDFYRILGRTDANVLAANNHIMKIVPARTGSEQGDIYAYWPQAEDLITPSSPIPENVSRNAGTLYAPWPFPPIAAAFYLKFVERGTVVGAAFSRIFELTEDGASKPDLQIDSHNTSHYRVVYNNGVDAEVNKTAAAAPALGDLVELLGWVYDDGSVQLAQAINGADPVVTTASNAPASGLLPWPADMRVYLNSHATGGRGSTELLKLVFARGAPTMPQMRSVFP